MAPDAPPSSDAVQPPSRTRAAPPAFVARLERLQQRGMAHGSVALRWFMTTLTGPLALLWHALRLFSGDLTHPLATQREASQAEAAGARGPTAHGFLAWRRSGLFVLLPLVLTGLVLRGLHLQDRVTTLREGEQTLQQLAEVFRPVAPLLVEELDLLDAYLGAPALAAHRWASLAAWGITAVSAALALAAFASWAQYRRSRRLLLAAWLVSLVPPLAANVVPVRLLLRQVELPEGWIDLGAGILVPSSEIERLLRQVEPELGALAAMFALLAMAPIVVTIFPAIMRAGIHARRLVPESPLPGWIVIVTPPIYILSTTAYFGAINQLAGDLSLFLGITATLLGPAVFMFGARGFTRPSSVENAVTRVRVVRLVGTSLTLGGWVVLVVYVLGLPLVWESGLVTTGRLVETGLDTLARFILTTIVATDIVVHMLLVMQRQSWRHLRGDDELRDEYLTRLSELVTMEHRTDTPEQ